MTSGRVRRFLKLERPRPARDGEADPAAASAERFEGVERPGAPPARPRTSGARLDRFGPEPDPPIELVETSAGERPFTRCMRCGMDHNVFATKCSGCGASLDTEAQRDFNERLWATRQKDAAREAQHAAEREELRARAEADLDRQRRAMGEELAREVGERERRRLGGWDGDWGRADHLASRLLALFRDPPTRAAVAVGGAAALVLLAIFGLARPSARPALYAAIVLAVLLFVPPRRPRRRW